MLLAIINGHVLWLSWALLAGAILLAAISMTTLRSALAVMQAHERRDAERRRVQAAASAL